MALGGVLLSGFVGNKMGRRMAAGMSTSPIGMLGKIGTIGGMTALGAGVGLAKTGMNVLQHGTQLTNPMFSNVTGQSYGKRGIDANNLNTKGLVQSLHSNRRRSQ